MSFFPPTGRTTASSRTELIHKSPGYQYLFSFPFLLYPHSCLSWRKSSCVSPHTIPHPELLFPFVILPRPSSTAANKSFLFRPKRLVVQWWFLDSSTSSQPVPLEHLACLCFTIWSILQCIQILDIGHSSVFVRFIWLGLNILLWAQIPSCSEHRDVYIWTQNLVFCAAFSQTLVSKDC